MIDIFRVVIVLGHRVHNLKLVVLSKNYHILLIYSVDSCIMVSVRMGGICSLTQVRFVIGKQDCPSRVAFGSKVSYCNLSAPTPKGAFSCSITG